MYRKNQDELEKLWWEEHVDVGASLSMPLPGGTSPPAGLPERDGSSACWKV